MNEFDCSIIQRCLWTANRKGILRRDRKRNQKKNCSIISCNCIGGMLCHDLGIRFDSPTVNCWFEADDFVRFCEDLQENLKKALTSVTFDTHLGYPVAVLNQDIRIYFQHYATPEEAEDKWEKRRQRVDFDNLFLIATDRDGMNRELLERFLKLPYRKIVYVGHEDMVLGKECIYIPGFESEPCLPVLSDWADLKGHRYYDKYFDIVGWLNNAENQTSL